MKKFIVVIAVIFAIDFITKLIILKTMDETHSITVIDGLFYITSTRNTGAAWSSFAGQRYLLLAFTAVSLIIFTYLARDIDFNTKKLYSFSLAFMFGGAFGNLFDRIVYHEVVDFLDFQFGNLNFPVFNFADIALVLGVIGMMYHLIFLEKKEWK